MVASNPHGKILELDAVNLKRDKTFDGIYTKKVLHHLTDEELMDSVKRQFDILNPDGIVCHTFWKGEGSEVFKGLFVNYHHNESLIEIFTDYFEILSVERYKEFEDRDSLFILEEKNNPRNRITP